MLLWLFAGLVSVGFVELFIRLPILSKCNELKATIARGFVVIRSRRISDHWKEKALVRYALRMLGLTMQLGAYICTACFPLVSLYLISVAIDIPLIEFMQSLVGILFVTIVSIVYARVRF